MTDTDMLYMASLEKRNAELEARVAELEEKHWNECGQIAHYSDELRRTKELLKKAVEGMRWLNENTQDSDGSCAIRTEHGCSGCPLDINGDLFCKWKHEAEALALIGEDGDTND